MLTMGKLESSPIVHLANDHDIMICLGFGVEQTVPSASPSDLCRLCFGHGLRYTAPRAPRTVRA